MNKEPSTATVDSTSRIGSLKEALSRDPHDEASGIALIAICIHHGRFDEARCVYEDFRNHNSDFREAGRLCATAFEERGEIARAEAIYRDLITAYPDEYPFYKSLEKLYVREEMPEKAISLYKKIGRSHPLREKSFKRLTGLYWRSGDLRKAQACVKKEIKEFGPTPHKYKELGKLYLADRQYVRAVQSFQNALARESHDRECRIWLGVALMENGNYELAEYEFLELLKEKPRDFQALVHLAEVRIREGRFGKAEELLALSDDYYPGNPRVKLCRAEIEYLQGRYENSLILGREALREIPFYFIRELARCHRLLQHTHRALKDRRKARLHKEMKQALSKSRDVCAALVSVGELKVTRGRIEEGKEILVHLLELDPRNVRAMVALAEAHAAAGEDKEAVACAERVLLDAPERRAVEITRAHEVLCGSYARREDQNKAAHHRRQKAAVSAKRSKRVVR